MIHYQYFTKIVLLLNSFFLLFCVALLESIFTELNGSCLLMMLVMFISFRIPFRNTLLTRLLLLTDRWR